MTDITPTDTPPGPNWRVVADDEEVLAGDMYQVGDADYQEWLVRFQAGRNTNRTYYRRTDLPATKDDTVSKKSPKAQAAEIERLNNELQDTHKTASTLFDECRRLRAELNAAHKQLEASQPKVPTKLEQRAADIAEAMQDQASAWHDGHNDSLLNAEEFAECLTVNALQYLQDGITLWAISKGWMTEEPRNPAEQLMLIVTELAEACEAFRVGNPPCERPGMEHFSHAAEELADVVIRCFQMAGEHSIPLGEVIQAKMKFNHTRPIKHGKKF